LAFTPLISRPSTLRIAYTFTSCAIPLADKRRGTGGGRRNATHSVAFVPTVRQAH
jgi:hypothetical protein